MVFFIFYSAYFMPMPEQPKPQQASEQQTAPAQQTTNTTAAPQVTTSGTTPTQTATPQPVVQKTATDATLVNVQSANYTIEVDGLGRIASMHMKDPKYQDPQGNPVQVVNKELPKPLELRFNDQALNEEAFKTPYTTTVSDVTVQGEPVQVVLTQKLSKVTVTKTITFTENGHYELAIALSEDLRYFVSPGFEPKVNTYMMTVMGALMVDTSDQIHIVEDGDAMGNESFRNIKIASAFDRYYATLFYQKEGRMNVVLSKTYDGQDMPIIFVEGEKNFAVTGYIGPKEFRTLKAIGPELTEAVEYGWFTWMAKPVFWLLQELVDITGNWGWAIVLLTILIRFVLYPLTYKGMVSMQKLKDIAPLMKEIQTKYKGDPQRMNAKMMELYKKHGANPMGGCLPLLLQIPVFFAIYRVLLNSIELQGAEWILWIEDLAVLDPYYVLPILMGATMYYQQRITPSNFQDPMQEKIFRFLPVIFTLFFLTFPAGLTLYWFVNNLFSILQQFIVNKQFEKMREAKAAKNDQD
jgi:YidC/Oxa1 family membrane protein insertase